jgi:hypothetical protein
MLPLQLLREQQRRYSSLANCRHQIFVSHVKKEYHKPLFFFFELCIRFPSRLERIPNESRVDVINIKETKLQLEMGSFVTLKQFPYKVSTTNTTTTTTAAAAAAAASPPTLSSGRRWSGHRPQTQRTNR